MLYVKPTRKAVRAIEVEGETMLHDPATQQVYVLNPTAALIWSLCDGNHTIEQMIEVVKTQFSQTALADIVNREHIFLTALSIHFEKVVV